MTRAVFERKVWSGCRNGEKAGERRLGHEARTHASHARITLMALYAFRIGKKKTTVISLTESQQKRLAKVLNDSIRDILTFTAKNITKILFIRPISAVSNSIQRILNSEFDRNSTFESAAAFLPPVGPVFSHYPTEVRHRFKRQISAVSNR